MAHACDGSSTEAEEGNTIQSQPELYNEALALRNDGPCELGSRVLLLLVGDSGP